MWLTIIKKLYFVSLSFIVVGLLYSCGNRPKKITEEQLEQLIELIASEKPESLESKNIYKDVNMKLFKGFVDKMTLNELFEKKGKPDTILDANEVAAIEGYDIYEYHFPDGAIDCYVKKGISPEKAIVDYVYFEPKNEIALADFVANSRIRSQIPRGKSVVYYIGDGFYDIIRLRLNKNDNNKIINVALNDGTIFIDDIGRRGISKWVAEIDQSLPLPYGDIGSISKIELSEDKLYIVFNVNEHDDINVNKIVQNNPNWFKDLAMHLFNPFGLFRGMTNELLKQESSIRFCMYGNVSNKRIEATLDANTFKEHFAGGVSNQARLYSIVSINNFTLPNKINDYLILGKQSLKDNMLVIPFMLVNGERREEPINLETVKLQDISLLYNAENPERLYFTVCARCNYGIKKIYYFEDEEDSIEIVYTPEEIKELKEKF